ncbi:pilus assembly PilX family protein [Teredinibacter haidensis]|uniref:pilus assembly PilX family protein n=1 Tax=Teredinibacter haidensis TaxID=2731755 RepID=UPI0009490EAA|nr:PilX N-terminal domain-containing pilus assembly protein [Teredinibacter haidensis]
MRPTSIYSQRGVTLAVTLIFMFVLFLVGVSAVRVSLVEEKMTGNLRDKHIAFEASESGLVTAEEWLDGLHDYPEPTDAGVHQVWKLGLPGTGGWWKGNAKTWWTANGVAAAGNTLQYAAPRYIIEERSFSQKGENLVMGDGPVKQGKFYYQITSRGHGGAGNTRVHLRSTFVKRYD